MESETMTLAMYLTEYWVYLALVGFGLALVAVSILSFSWGEEYRDKQLGRKSRDQWQAYRRSRGYLE